MRKFALGLVLVLGAQGAVAAPQREGTAPETFAATNPPAPSAVSVAVLPFWAANQRQIEIARGAILLNLQRHGFGIVPAAESLPVCAQETDRVVKADGEREPGARIQRDDGVRLGRALNAQWVIYGEIENLRATMHVRLWRTRKVGSIDIRLVLADVASGQILYWVRIRDTGSGGTGFWAAKASSVERQLALRTINLIFDDLNRALPPHKTGPQVSEEQVQQFIEAMGQ
jgi:hypothetical protein